MALRKRWYVLKVSDSSLHVLQDRCSVQSKRLHSAW